GEGWDTQSLVRKMERDVLRPLIDLNFGEKAADAQIQHPPLSRELKQRVFDIFKSLVANHPDYSSINFKAIADAIGIPIYSDAELQKINEQKFADAHSMAEITQPQQPDQPVTDTTKNNSQQPSTTVVVNPQTEITNVKELMEIWSDKNNQVIDAVQKTKVLGGV